MTTAQDLIDRASGFGRDAAGGFLTSQDYLDWCNEAQVDIIARQQIFEQEAEAFTDGTNAISFPVNPGLVEILELRLGTDVRVAFVDSTLWNINVDAGTTPIGTIARLFDEHIEFYPTPAIDTLATIRYKRLPVPLTTGESVIEVPAQLERKIVEYMKAQARFKDGDFQAGNNWLGLYEQGLAPVSSGREKYYAGPLNFGLEETWFETDARQHRTGLS